MRTHERLIAIIAVGFWLSLVIGNQLAANQGSYKPTEEALRIKKELERLEEQVKEGEKVLEKFRKQDEDEVKRIAQENEARRTRKFQLKLIVGGIFVVVTLGVRMLRKQGCKPSHQPSRSSPSESFPQSPASAKPQQSTNMPDWKRELLEPLSQGTDCEVAPRVHHVEGEQ